MGDGVFVSVWRNPEGLLTTEKHGVSRKWACARRNSRSSVLSVHSFNHVGFSRRDSSNYRRHRQSSGNCSRRRIESLFRPEGPAQLSVRRGEQRRGKGKLPIFLPFQGANERVAAIPSNPVRSPRHHDCEPIVGTVDDHCREDVGIGVQHLGALEFDAGF